MYLHTFVGCATGCNVCSDSSYNSCFNCSAGYYLVSNDDSSNTGYCTSK